MSINLNKFKSHLMKNSLKIGHSLIPYSARILCAKWFWRTPRCVQTNFHNALTRVNQFVCTNRRSYTSLEKEQSIAYIYIFKQQSIFDLF